MLKTAIPVIAAFGLAAAAAQSYATDPAPAAPGMGWHLSHEGDWAKLAYGAENSDQLALMLMCEPGQTQAVVYGDVQPAAARMIDASAPIDPLSGDMFDEARLNLNDRSVRGLVDNGRIVVETETGRAQLTATRDERRLISHFVSYCSQSRA
ncbi:hypothetical protein ACIQC9_03070 [Brevundimonas sp. NPDC092305]|uniref:hypothetical protein n=1 Tax=Brevundimonas sp. NPDC092305 TaxID=3363957 RepID=UPI0038134598